MRTLAAPFVAALVAILVALPAGSATAATPTYNRDIRPILSDNCFACHGFDEKGRKADLRLDTLEGATESGAIVPGDAAASTLWDRITADAPDEVMPPPESHKTLTPEQKDLLRRWIDAGAAYEPHWSFVPPARVAPPAVAAASWPRSDLDRFILARLEQEGLVPAPEADKAALIRRVTLDLTGLPPTLAQVDAFLADASPQAYEKVVDRLLASPHYGERMAVDWLDAARYADTNGYQVDRDREMWPWRDWVIASFNANQPFDQFTIEQLAGDLLPGATVEQRLATGFNRNHMINEEGGIIPDEFLAEYTADRVETTAAVWLGQTFACCRCHDHKYDPFTARDFYALKAFFHNVPELGMGRRQAKPNASSPPVLALPSAELDARKAALAARVAALEADRTALAERPPAGWEAWTERLVAAPPEWQPLAAESATGTGFEVSVREGRVQVEPELGDGLWSFRASMRPHAGRVTAVRLVGQAAEADSLFRMHRVAAEATVAGKATPLVLRPLVAGGSLATEKLRPLVTPDNIVPPGFTVAAGRPLEAVFALDPPLEPQEQVTIRLTVHARANTDVTRWRLEVTSDDPGLLVPAAVRAAAATPAADRSPADRAALGTAFAATTAAARTLDDQIAAVRKQIADVDLSYPASMVMEEMAVPRDTFILVRGQYDKPGEKVTAATPAVLPPLAPGLPTNRLGLARWLVDPAHPLTARVAVNRFWQQVFGTGLVKTSEDFGSQGAAPSHPELLDWLAGEFVRTGWDVKRLMRLLVTSATYRQDARLRPDLLARDPDNRLLARGPRFRLAGEFVRDQALAVSGLLMPRIGGPSVRPYHPPGLYETMAPTSPDTVKTWVQDHGGSLYRRSLYTFWKRSIPHPALLAFGTPFRETCTLQRPRSNTPLQALNLMNDETYVEASRFLAERMMTEAGAAADARLAHGFRLVLARPPSAEQLAILRRGHDRARVDFARDPAAARGLLAVGEKPATPGLDPVEHAALTVVASTILCLDDAVTKQ
jgi:mono/diheme cytochrome c family protein